MPYIMFKDKNSSSPLQIAIERNDVTLVNYLMEFCTIVKDNKLLYNSNFSSLLFKFNNDRINIKPFLNSCILFHRIDCTN
jgi:hypothetical protein